MGLTQCQAGGSRDAFDLAQKRNICAATYFVTKNKYLVKSIKFLIQNTTKSRKKKLFRKQTWQTDGHTAHYPKKEINIVHIT
jgi:hypothetical protein